MPYASLKEVFPNTSFSDTFGSNPRRKVEGFEAGSGGKPVYCVSDVNRPQLPDNHIYNEVQKTRGTPPTGVLNHSSFAPVQGSSNRVYGNSGNYGYNLLNVSPVQPLTLGESLEREIELETNKITCMNTFEHLKHCTECKQKASEIIGNKNTIEGFNGSNRGNFKQALDVATFIGSGVLLVLIMNQLIELGRTQGKKN